jgi:16S rRNA (uracil1498-N3)-methyltransferase
VDLTLTGAAGLRRRPLVFVADLDHPHLAPEDLHHFERVLRVARGAPVTLGDGDGRWREARFGPEPEPVGAVGREVALQPALTVAFVPIKAQGPEWQVQKLTELGVDEIVPVVSARSVVRWDGARAARQHERLIRVAREACLQCRRLTLPRVSPLVSLDLFLDQCRDRGRPAVLADPAGSVMEPVRLPGHVLRAETAAVAAATVACGLRAGLLAPGSQSPRPGDTHRPS